MAPNVNEPRRRPIFSALTRRCCGEAFRPQTPGQRRLHHQAHEHEAADPGDGSEEMEEVGNGRSLGWA